MRAGSAVGGRLLESLASRVSQAAERSLLPATVALLFYAAAGQGAFFRPQASVFAAGLLGLALAAGLVNSELVPFLAGIAFLVAGLIAAGLVSGWGANDYQVVAALAAAGATVPLTRHLIAAGQRKSLLEAVSWMGAAGSGIGIVGVVFHQIPWALPAGTLWRNSSTLTYANAAGCFFVLALGASVFLMSEGSSPTRRALAFLTVTGLATTLSRGALVGIVVGLLVLAAFKELAILRPLARPTLAALISFICIVPSITSTPHPLLGLAGVVVGGIVAVIERGGTDRPRHLPIVLLVSGIALLVGLGAASSTIGRFVQRRVAPSSESRTRTWKNTWKLAIEKPFLGYGPGTFSMVEDDPKAGPVLTRYVHNEYLQAFFETGLVGLATILGAIVAFGSWVMR